MSAAPSERPALTIANTLICCVFVGGIVYGLPAYLAWLVPAATPTVVECDPPIEPEQLQIAIVKINGRYVGKCIYVGSRGTYSRRTQ